MTCATPKDLLIVFLKYPRPGAVKTRLAVTIGAERAAALYREWVGQLLVQWQSIRPRISLIGYYEGAEEKAFSEWAPLVDEWWPQPAGDLGMRLTEGFCRGHSRPARTVAIGTDCLEVDAGSIEIAFRELDSHQVVIGPATDGGYYLIGSAEPRPGLFENIHWSSDRTLSDQLEVCRRHQWSTALLPLRSDIDTWDDWLAHCKRQKRQP